jgi:hypothetical protein
MSGTRRDTFSNVSCPSSPLALLSLISLRQIVCSAASRVKHLLANALARACATIWLCQIKLKRAAGNADGT